MGLATGHPETSDLEIHGPGLSTKIAINNTEATFHELIILPPGTTAVNLNFRSYMA